MRIDLHTHLFTDDRPAAQELTTDSGTICGGRFPGVNVWRLPRGCGTEMERSPDGERANGELPLSGAMGGRQTTSFKGEVSHY